MPDSDRKPCLSPARILLIVLLIINVTFFFCDECSRKLSFLSRSKTCCAKRAFSYANDQPEGWTARINKHLERWTTGVGSCNRDNQTDTYRDRLVLLQKMCKYKDLNNTLELRVVPNVIALDTEHPILFCPIQKASSSFWTRVLNLIGTKGEKSNPYEMSLDKKHTDFGRLQNKMSEKQISIYLSNLFTFLFVREPYSRLFSAYVDKVYYPNYVFWPKLIDEIIDEVRVNKAHMSYVSPVTFQEFIQYLLKLYDNNRQLDKHYAPMHALCDPCALEYSFLGKLETFDDDAACLIDMWKNKYKDFNISFTDFPKEAMADDVIRHVAMILDYLNIKGNVPNKEKHDIFKRGWDNLKQRGYIDKNMAFPFTLNEVNEITPESFMNRINSLTSGEPLSKDRAKEQRMESFVQAYKTLTDDELEKLRLFVLEDCRLFGYDDRPSDIFNRDTPVSPYKYFPDL